MGSQTFIVNLNYLFHRFSIFYEAERRRKKNEIGIIYAQSPSHLVFTSENNDSWRSIASAKANESSQCPRYLAFICFKSFFFLVHSLLFVIHSFPFRAVYQRLMMFSIFCTNKTLTNIVRHSKCALWFRWLIESRTIMLNHIA